MTTHRDPGPPFCDPLTEQIIKVPDGKCCDHENGTTLQVIECIFKQG